jgi:cytochrome P450
LTSFSISIGFYRLFLNPLKAFPGDTLPALTKWQSFWIAKDGRTHHFLWEQHKRHGDYVRVGPNELSVSDVDALPYIHGAKSKFSKGPWYWKALNEPSPGLFSMQDYNEHKLRRKVWDTAFNPKALKAYEPRIMNAINTLCKRLDEFSSTGEVIDFSVWTEYMAFDIMGDLGFVSHKFGRPFWKISDRSFQREILSTWSTPARATSMSTSST